MAVREIHILHHTHVDVGYTDFQPAVCDLHPQFIGQALDYCTQTDDYPEEARFRWINEFSWSVVSFLQRHPERAEELFRRLREGRFEVCGLYLDPTELQDRRSLEVSLEPALKMAQEQGFPLSAVMTSDIPGQGWSLPDVMAERGLGYLSVSPNSMVSKPAQVQRPFYWVGPRGNRVLVWLTDWRNGWYGEGHVLGFPAGLEVSRERVGEYLDLLASEGYPWEVLALHMASDNRPPIRDLSDLVLAWNQRGDMPPMRMSTNRDFLDRMVELHDGHFPEHRLAWPDWWSEGLGTAAYEVSLSRETHCALQRIEALQGRLQDSRDLWPIWEELLLFDEHTWGCQNMALRPHAFMSRATWTHKSLHIYKAADAARRVEGELMAGLRVTREAAEQADHRDGTVAGPAAGATELTICNPAPHVAWVPVALPGLAADVTRLIAEDGSELPVQRSEATPLAEAQAWSVVWARQSEVKRLRAASGGAGAPQSRAFAGSIENEFLRVTFDESGCVRSILDLVHEDEWVDRRAPWQFAEVIHEHISGDQDREAVWEKGYTQIPYGKRRTDAPFVRQGSRASSALLSASSGPLFESVISVSALPWAPRIETEVRLWRDLKRVDVEVRIDKQPCQPYESLYVAFPFALEKPRAFIHSCGAVFEAEAEQLPGSCRDFYAVEHFAAFQAGDRYAAMTPLDSPLVMLGDLTFGRWADHLTIDRGCFFAWLTNNFWYTNFPGIQLGHLRFRFVLEAGRGELNLAAAERLGGAARVGLSVG